MKVKEGDILICNCEDCTLELTVTKACTTEKCGVECEINAECCGEPMSLKK